ncbi:hypothetical protein [Ktedonospora formicarum]|uniref:Uncharacterized protein n=1 Tax=Ktedonospora formicarum TaxID=2778364 RepID=A0A8J3MQI7_9CHLR|nr:hypothetical protein [Ktedonospora formicarum]GHO44952.1 hypothetical protein KSX_31150 [Ktedonospora formicarum]
MNLHNGERVFWGAPEVIYLEGTITATQEENQTIVVHIDRATPHSAHLIGSDVPFAANGLKPLLGDSPPGTTEQRAVQALPPLNLSDDEKIQRGAAVAVHQQYGYDLPKEQEQALIAQVAEVIERDKEMRQTIIHSMDEILRRER